MEQNYMYICILVYKSKYFVKGNNHLSLKIHLQICLGKYVKYQWTIGEEYGRLEENDRLLGSVTAGDKAEMYTPPPVLAPKTPVFYS